jgi:alkylation response protein AidB-like acyl-CoA dehydrogenase
MDFGLSDDQRLFQEALRGYLADRAPIPRVREVMASTDGHDESLLAGLAEQGVCGILIAAEHGGSQLSLLDAAIAAEELGAAATPYSYHSAGVMAPLAIERGGSDEQRARWLPDIAAGRCIVSVVDDDTVTIAAGKLRGSVMFVPDAAVADAFVVFCDVGAGREALLVETGTPGLQVQPLATIDETRRVGELQLDGVGVDDSMRLARLDEAGIDRIIDAGRIVLAADALGASARSLKEAVAYSLERKQFGRVVGSFQAVKHMCAETYAEVEPVRSLLWYAAFAWDEGYDDASVVACMLKAHSAEVATAATTTCVQVYGGMGFTHECDMHIWFKRAGYDRQMLGGPASLRDRVAMLRYG